jgi:predicted ArsR family transcriptional regulator
VRRENFIRLCAGCACSGAAFAAALAQAQEQPAAAPQPDKPDSGELEWQLNACRQRFAKLLSILDEDLDEPVRKKILRRLGAECAQGYSALFAKYKGNINGFLDEVRRQWVAEAVYDEKAGSLRIVDRATRCTCPLVKPGTTPAAFCDCTLGWQQAAYSAVLGKPVAVELEESILRGGKRCVFRVHIIQ